MRNNPIKEARLDLNLTQHELASRAMMTPNALIKYEQGLYPEVSTKIITALAWALDQDLTSYSAVLSKAYKNWRVDKLLDARIFFRHNTEVRGLNPTGGVNPFVCWRTHHLHISSRLEFCKLLVLHPAVVQKYEQGEMRQMPESLYKTLLIVGVTKDSLDYLDILGERYYDRINTRRV
jgi:transcriptional regulator with XRE-family HTH domain